MHFTPPLIRWAGSKRLSLPLLMRFVRPGMNRYVEPFCGSSALYYQLNTHDALLSDINQDLINFYKVVQLRPEDLYDAAVSLPRDAETYYSCRHVFNESNDSSTGLTCFTT